MEEKYWHFINQNGFEYTLYDFHDKKPARTLREAAAVIENVCGLKRSLPQVMKFLKNGFSPLKVGFLPAKADHAKQKTFVEDTLKPLIKRGLLSYFLWTPLIL